MPPARIPAPASFADFDARYPQKSSSSGDAGKALDAYTGAPLAMAAGVGVTKRASMVLSGDGLNSITGSSLNILMRSLCALPHTVTRLRLRYKNTSAWGEAGFTGAIRIRGLQIATPDLSEVDAQGRWAGRIKTGGTQLVAATTSPADGTAYVSGWVTNTGFQSANVPFALSIGLDSNGATQSHFSENRGGLSWQGSGCSDLFADTTTVAGAGYTGLSNLFKGGLIIEYETVTTAKHLVVLGDSIDDGYPFGALLGAVNNSHPALESWPSIAALRNGFLLTNMAVASMTSANVLLWESVGGEKWTRVDTTTTPPDVFCMGLGSNDLALNSRTAAQLIADDTALVAACRVRWPAAMLAWRTIIPRNGITVQQEADRQTVNTWRRSLPLGATYLWDADAALRLQASPATAETDCMGGVDPHPKRAGYQRMAQLARI